MTAKSKLGDRVRINIGGVLFKCYTGTLRRFEGSLLANLEDCSHYYDHTDDEYFFDRNPLLFDFILEAYRTGTIHLPKDICSASFKAELDFWGLPVDHVAPCCWEALYRSEDDVQTIEALGEFFKVDTHFCANNRTSIRNRLWLFLNQPKSSNSAKAWGLFISIVITISILMNALETVSYARTRSYNEVERRTINRVIATFGTNTSKVLNNLLNKPHVLVTVTDMGCMFILTLELTVLLLLSPKRSEMYKSVLLMMEVVSSVAFWFSFGCEQNFGRITSNTIIWGYIICKYLSALRIVRLYRIANHIPALRIIRLTFTVSKYEMSVLTIILMILTSLFGVVLFLTEATENDTFENLFSAMYCAVITMTTVGYGDYFARTSSGNVATCVCAVCGVLLLALPIGIITSSFQKLYHHYQYVSRHVQSHKQTNDVQ